VILGSGFPGYWLPRLHSRYLGPGVTRAAFSAIGEINRIDFGVCTNPPVPGLASEEILLDIEAGVVLRRQQ
jgi:hypothetical protein